MAGGVVTYFGDSAVVCESGKGKVNSEQGTGNDSNSTNQAGDDKSQE